MVSGGGTYFGGGGGPTPYFSPQTPNHKGSLLCTFGYPRISGGPGPPPRPPWLRPWFRHFSSECSDQACKQDLLTEEARPQFSENRNGLLIRLMRTSELQISGGGHGSSATPANESCSDCYHRPIAEWLGRRFLIYSCVEKQG